MRIDFFVEFPENGLKKAALVDFPSTIYIAGKSYLEFQKYKEILKQINPKAEAAYWPILDGSYWVSPFSFSYELKRIKEEMEQRCPKESLELLIDLEPPMLNKKLFIANFFNFWKNKKRIGELFRDAESLNIKIATAESDFALWGQAVNRIMQYAGLSYPGGHEKIIMYYSSMLPVWRQRICQRGIRGNMTIGLGTTDIGIQGDEPRLSPEGLKRDLTLAEEKGVKRVAIFQLSGLDDSYLKVIKKYYSP